MNNILNSRLLKYLLIYILMMSLTILNILGINIKFAIGKEKNITEIFIESNGNNKYEAQIKAHELGMMRALKLIADQMHINKDDIKEVPYNKLKKAFKPVTIINEVSTIENYTATVTYEYNQENINKILLEYGSSAVDDLFYEYLILPVFKQKKMLNIWANDKRWNDFWQQSRDILKRYKLLYPEATPHLRHNITSDNIFKFNYQDFTEVFPKDYFKKVMIVTAEFFTDRKTRESLVQVNKIILSPEQAEPLIIKEEYPLNDIFEVGHTVDLIIDKIIDKHGKIRIQDEETSADTDIFVNTNEPKPIIMNFDVFDQEEMDLVISKLKNVAEIDHFKIEPDYNNRYKILIYTNYNEYELAEGLYLNGLTYRIHGNLYNLIDVKKGT